MQQLTSFQAWNAAPKAQSMETRVRCSKLMDLVDNDSQMLRQLGDLPRTRNALPKKHHPKTEMGMDLEVTE